VKLAVSNIAWSKEEEPAIASLLQDLNVRYVEIAPTKQWEDPTVVPDSEIEDYKNWWQGYGIEVIAFQSMLFNRPNLKLFEDDSTRAEMASYLKDFIGVAGKMGVKTMVFGSPKNRQKGSMKQEIASSIATSFFKDVGHIASVNGVNFCIEPNAPQYSCDFVTNAAEGIKLVKQVDSKGFGLHLDIACMALANDNIADSIISAAPLLRHFHISSPMLGDVVPRPDVDHEQAAGALRSIGYKGYVSIEMRPMDGSNLERVKSAVDYAQGVYSS
jgi:D-psicose/D-tagatose/L-ribulose 3-epimerase